MRIPPGVLVVMVVAALAIAWWRRRRRVSYFDPYRDLKKTLQALPRVDISAAATGTPSRVVGRAGRLDGVPLLTAPASGRPCLAWRITVEQTKFAQGRRARRAVVLDRSAAGPFAIQDASGVAAIAGERLELLLDVDEKQSSGFLRNPPPSLQQLLSAHGISHRELVGNKSMSFREGIVAEGEHVALGGVAAWEAGPGSRVIVAPLPTGSLPVCDDPALRR